MFTRSFPLYIYIYIYDKDVADTHRHNYVWYSFPYTQKHINTNIYSFMASNGPVAFWINTWILAYAYALIYIYIYIYIYIIKVCQHHGFP